VRVLNEKFVMGRGGRGRGGSTSRQESNGNSKEEKESSKSDVQMTADKIRKLVAKILKELSSNTNPSLLVFLCSWFVLLSEETIRAWMFMRELEYVTDPELSNQYKEAEARREEWFEANGWEFTPKVEPDTFRVTLLPYDSVVDINGRTELNRGKQDAFVKFMDTPKGPCRTVDYDRTICGALPGAFGSRTTLSIEKYESVQISVNGSTKILDDGINLEVVGANNKVNFTKLQLDSAVQEAVKSTVHETVTAMAKNGWKQP
jgi:hypothetical protein